MTKPKNSVHNLRMAMRYARRRTYCTVQEAAQLLRVSEKELLDYEQGNIDIPMPVLEIMLMMGYTMLRARHVQYEYWRMQRMLVRENIPIDAIN